MNCLRLIGFWKPQHFFGDITERELLRYGRDSREHRLSQIAFNVILLCISESTVGQQRCFARPISCFCTKKLRRRCFGAARLTGIMQGCGLAIEQSCSFEFDPAFSERMLNALVLTNGSVEYGALSRVGRSTLQRGTTKSYGL